MLSLAVSSATELEIEPSDLALNMRSPPPADDMRLLELMISLAERMEPPIMGKSGFVPEDVPTDALWLLDRAHTILTLIGSSCNMNMKMFKRQVQGMSCRFQRNESDFMYTQKIKNS